MLCRLDDERRIWRCAALHANYAAVVAVAEHAAADVCRYVGIEQDMFN